MFSILLTSKPGDNRERLTSKSRALGLFAAVAMALMGGWALVSRCANFVAKPAMQAPDMEQIGTALMGTAMASTFCLSRLSSILYSHV